jgi:hypothetical protein
LFYATWVYPVGLRHDPFVCDAARSRAKQWSEHVDVLASVHLGIRCDTTATTFEVTGIAERFEETMTGIQPVLSDTSLDASRMTEDVERTLQTRSRLREDPFSRAHAFHEYALRREASVDRWMPSDAQLQHAPVERFEQALSTMTATDPYVLYAGPDPKRFAELLAAPTGADAPLEATTLQLPERPTVYLLGAADAPPEAYVSVVRTAVDDPTGTLASALDRAPPPGLAQARNASVVVSNPTLFHFVAQKLPAHVWVYGGPPDALLDVVDAALEDLSHLSPADDMQTLRPRLEDEYRLGRVPDGRIPDVVLWWGPGQTVDPRMQRWAAIGSLDDTRLAAYFEAVGRQPAIVSVVADPAALDRARLERWGRVVELEPADFLRDVAMSDTKVPGPR